MSYDNINACMFSGRIVSNAVKRTSRSGNTIALFSIAVNGSVYDASKGTYESTVSYVDLVATGNIAIEACEKAVKGRKVLVCCSLYQSTRIEDDGRKRTFYNYHVNEIEYMSENKYDTNKRRWSTSNWI